MKSLYHAPADRGMTDGAVYLGLLPKNVFFFYDMVCCSIFTGKNLKNVKKKQCLNTDANIKINNIKTKHTISFNPFFYFIIFFY